MRQRLFNTWWEVDAVGSAMGCLASLWRLEFTQAVFAGAWTLASPFLLLFAWARPGVLHRFLLALSRR